MPITRDERNYAIWRTAKSHQHSMDYEERQRLDILASLGGVWDVRRRVGRVAVDNSMKV
jgi:hypothetical protein